MNPLKDYLERFTPLRPAPLLPEATPKSNERVLLKWLIDETYAASRLMVQTHYKDDIIRFIVLVQTLDGLGYATTWLKHQHVVTIERKVRYANAGANAGAD